jgi:hypothetical protein
MLGAGVRRSFRFRLYFPVLLSFLLEQVTGHASTCDRRMPSLSVRFLSLSDRENDYHMVLRDPFSC